jgi:hypothetical protein
MKTPSNLKWIFVYKVEVLRPYSKSSLALTLNKWRFNLSFSWVSMLFLNSCRVSSYIVRYDTNPPAIQKQDWHWREAQIEPPLIECAFRIRAQVNFTVVLRFMEKQLLCLELFTVIPVCRTRWNDFDDRLKRNRVQTAVKGTEMLASSRSSKRL